MKSTDRQKAIKILQVELTPLFNGAISARDLSDLRQVAHAIASDIPFFVTRDGAVLSRSSTIFEKYGLRILHPTDLINHFDSLRREAEYRPGMLEGSCWRERLLLSDDVPAVVSNFKHQANERSGRFEEVVRHYLAKPDQWDSKIVANGMSLPAIYLVCSRENPSRVIIPILRHIDHPLAGTLLRHLRHEKTRHPSPSQHKIIAVTDRQLSDEATRALTELGFVFEAKTW